VASLEHTEALDQALGDRYVSEFYGLRPEVPLALYVERGLWERFLATVTLRSPGPCVPVSDPAEPEDCSSAPVLALRQASSAR
jgi:hypothetical protein